MLHIIDLFRNTSADVLGQLVESAKRNDSLAVKNLAHKLKGSAGSLGLTALMNTCQSIEIAAEPLDTYNTQQGLLDEQVAASVNALDELMAE